MTGSLYSPSHLHVTPAPASRPDGSVAPDAAAGEGRRDRRRDLLASTVADLDRSAEEPHASRWPCAASCSTSGRVCFPPG